MVFVADFRKRYFTFFLHYVHLISLLNLGQVRAGFMESLLIFVIGVRSFCISTAFPMQFVQKRAHKSTNIVLGCEVVTLTTSFPVDFVQKLAYNWLLRFCGLRPV